MAEQFTDSGDIAKIQERLLEYRDARDWTEIYTPTTVAIAIAVESIQLIDMLSGKTPEEVAEYLDAHQSEVSERLVEILSNVLIFARDQNIDLVEAFETVQAENESKYPVKQ
ncbi:MAG: hypothetical protein Q7T74_05055 [Candidatus Saccharibacteria bacterium]|nr:hypothetical protein [Candidatus Saccharibacteria bacterium]